MIKEWRFSHINWVKSDFITINGYAVEEPMPPVLIDRPKGTGDWLIMAFHSPVELRIDNTISEFEKDRIIVWPTGIHQHYGSKRAPFGHSWIHCQGTLLDRLAKLTEIPLGRAIGPIPIALFTHSILAIHNEFTHFETPDERALENHFENIFYFLQRFSRDSDAELRIPENIRMARAWLEAHFRERITLEQAAKAAALSPSRFIAVFKRNYGVTPIDFLIRFRLSEARRELQDPNQRISDVARNNGFEDIYYFSRMIKKHFGVSPTALRGI